jgi:hypothetical protein
MPTPDAAGADSQTVAEILTNLRNSDKQLAAALAQSSLFPKIQIR